MKRIRFFAVALALLFVIQPVAAADFGLPAGKWWRLPEVATRLELTSEQQSRLDEVFLAAASDLIDLRGEVEKRSLVLRSNLDQTELNAEAVLAAARAVNEARGDLFEREMKMMLEMRKVLYNAQWDRLRRALAERSQRDRDRRPPATRPNRPNAN